jgi:hypothetical protein
MKANMEFCETKVKLIEWKATWKCMVATGEQERKASHFQHSRAIETENSLLVREETCASRASAVVSYNEPSSGEKK